MKRRLRLSVELAVANSSPPAIHFGFTDKSSTFQGTSEVPPTIERTTLAMDASLRCHGPSGTSEVLGGLLPDSPLAKESLAHGRRRATRAVPPISVNTLDTQGYSP